jgi:hypothetical protein
MMGEITRGPGGSIRSFPCPYCGETFDFPPGDTRLSAPCGRCGQRLIMPHGSFSMDHATMGMGLGGTADPQSMKPGIWSGGLTREQLDKLSPPKRKRRKSE